MGWPPRAISAVNKCQSCCSRALTPVARMLPSAPELHYNTTAFRMRRRYETTIATIRSSYASPPEHSQQGSLGPWAVLKKSIYLQLAISEETGHATRMQARPAVYYSTAVFSSIILRDEPERQVVPCTHFPAMIPRRTWC